MISEVHLKRMRRFKKQVKQWRDEGKIFDDNIYNISTDTHLLAVERHRLLDEQTVPTGMWNVVYNTFVRCHIR